MRCGDFHNGVALMPGVYDYHGEVHVDLDEYILACGGDPESQVDRETALAVLDRVCAQFGVPCIGGD